MPHFTRTWLRYIRVFAVANPSVCPSSVMLVHFTQRVEIVGNVSTPSCILTIGWPPAKLYADWFRGTPQSGGQTQENFHDNPSNEFPRWLERKPQNRQLSKFSTDPVCSDKEILVYLEFVIYMLSGISIWPVSKYRK